MAHPAVVVLVELVGGPEGLVDGIGPLDAVALGHEVPPCPRRQNHKLVPCAAHVPQASHCPYAALAE